jgi:hypothetical protein
VRVRFVPAAAQEGEREQTEFLTKVDRAQFSETDILPLAPVVPGEEIRPVAGGKAVLYSERPFLDENFATLLTTATAPSATHGNGTTPPPDPYFEVTQVTPRKIRVTLTEAFKKSDGSVPGAFDLVDAWTGMVRDHPAEGKALFYRLTGIDAFIKGQEAVIAGFQITDERTVTLNFSQNDPRALARLSTARLLPPSYKTGPYSCTRSEKNRIVLASNSACWTGTPFLEQCTVVLGNDNNPFVSFSLNQYDLVVLSQIRDLEYARRSQADKAVLIPLPRDIYFLSLTDAANTVRAYVRCSLNAKELLNGAAKVEGSVVQCIQSSDCADLPVWNKAIDSMPAFSEPLTILFRKDDHVSSRIAEKLVASLSRDSVRCVLKGCDIGEYEHALLHRDAGIVVGWVNESVWRDESERLRCAAIWFGDESDETARLKAGSEIPLFIVNRYALCKKNIALQNNELSRIFIKQ